MPSSPQIQKIKEQGKKLEKKLKIQTKECKTLEKKIGELKTKETKLSSLGSPKSK